MTKKVRRQKHSGETKEAGAKHCFIFIGGRQRANETFIRQVALGMQNKSTETITPGMGETGESHGGIEQGEYIEFRPGNDSCPSRGRGAW